MTHTKQCTPQLRIGNLDGLCKCQETETTETMRQQLDRMRDLAISNERITTIIDAVASMRDAGNPDTIARVYNSNHDKINEFLSLLRFNRTAIRGNINDLRLPK